MMEWNAVVTVRGQGFNRAIRLFRTLGSVERTHFYNVLIARVAEPAALLETLRARAEADPRLLDALARVTPIAQTFTFQSPEEFALRAREALRVVLPALAGQSYHVRVHRRGFKGLLSTPAEERALAEFLFNELEQAGTPGRITFTDADAIVVIEILGTQGGVALFRRDDLARYPFVRPD